MRNTGRIGKPKASQCPSRLPLTTNAMSIVSDLHQGLGMNVCSGCGRHTYMTRMYADKNIHIAFVLVAGRGVTELTCDECPLLLDNLVV